MTSEKSERGGEGTRVLVVDDEPNITDLVATALRYEGFTVETAATGRAALTQVSSFEPDIVLLDVMLPELDGFEVRSRMSERGDEVPVIFLTARDAPRDKVRGLSIGGDDYVTKPFGLEELIARIHAVLRRTGTRAARPSRLRFEDLELDQDTMEVRRGDRRIDLTPTEFKLLRFLMLNPRRVVSKGQILDHVWEYDFGGDASIVETYVSYLRKKLDVDEPRLIQTVRGFGYALRPPEP